MKIVSGTANWGCVAFALIARGPGCWFALDVAFGVAFCREENAVVRSVKFAGIAVA
jgi:hypothetical protein